jgi:hypothetical protein
MPVYLIRAGDMPFVKIGWADDVERRLSDLQTAHYEELSIIRVFVCERRVEGWLHHHFRDQHVRGEWYRFVPSMLTVAIGDVEQRSRGVTAEHRQKIIGGIRKSWREGSLRQTHKRQKMTGTAA